MPTGAHTSVFFCFKSVDYSSNSVGSNRRAVNHRSSALPTRNHIAYLTGILPLALLGEFLPRFQIVNLSYYRL